MLWWTYEKLVSAASWYYTKISGEHFQVSNFMFRILGSRFNGQDFMLKLYTRSMLVVPCV